LIHRFESLRPEEKASLAGKISHSVGLDPEFMNSLILKYGLPRIQQVRRETTR
jgi:hypothetical protein